MYAGARMGLFTDSIEGERDGRHFSIRTRFAWHGLGVVSTLYVDGRRRDVCTTLLRRSGVLTALVDGALVIAEIRQFFFSTRYRLFVDDAELPLHVEPGASSSFVALPPPMLPAFTGPQLGP